MDYVKIATALVSGTTLLLLAMALCLKNPEAALYQKTVQTLMEEEALASEQEVLAHFPVLREIQSDLQEIARLNQGFRDQFQSPIPNHQEGDLLLDATQAKMQQYRERVQTQLLQLLSNRINSRP